MKPAWSVNPKFEKFSTSLYMKLALSKFCEAISKIQSIYDVVPTPIYEVGQLENTFDIRFLNDFNISQTIFKIAKDCDVKIGQMFSRNIFISSLYKVDDVNAFLLKQAESVPIKTALEFCISSVVSKENFSESIIVLPDTFSFNNRASDATYFRSLDAFNTYFFTQVVKVFENHFNSVIKESARACYPGWYFTLNTKEYQLLEKSVKQPTTQTEECKSQEEITTSVQKETTSSMSEKYPTRTNAFMEELKSLYSKHQIEQEMKQLESLIKTQCDILASEMHKIKEELKFLASTGNNRAVLQILTNPSFISFNISSGLYHKEVCRLNIPNEKWLSRVKLFDALVEKIDSEIPFTNKINHLNSPEWRSPEWCWA